MTPEERLRHGELRKVKDPARDKRIHRTTIEEEVRLHELESWIARIQLKLSYKRQEAATLRKRIEYRARKEKEREINSGSSDSHSDGRGEVVPPGQPRDY